MKLTFELNRVWVRFSLIVMLVVTVSVLPILVIIQLAEQGVIQIDAADEEGEAELEHIPPRLAVLILVSATIGVITGVVASLQITRPMQNLVDGVKQIEHGELGHKITLEKASYEINTLAAAINSMSNALYESEQMRRRLMADVSHELRTPLTVLEGNLRAALDDVYALDGAEIANLHDQVHHLIRLVNDLHLLSRAESHQLNLTLQPSDLREIAEEVVANFKLFADEKNVALMFEAAPQLPQINIDTMRMRQVLTNLVDNALRHTTNGQHVKVSLNADVNDFFIVVADTGTGVEPTHLPHLFERFYRTDASRARISGGSGLGLAIVKALIELQGGSVQATSDGVGTGTRIEIRFVLA